MTKIRNFNKELDLAAWLELNHKIAQLDGFGEYGDKELKESLKYFSHNPDSDRWLIEDAGTLVGHAWIIAQTSYQAYFEISFMPSYRNIELFDEVFEIVWARAQSLKVTKLVASISAQVEFKENFVINKDFREVGQVRFFSATELLSPSSLNLPTGYKIKTVAELDDLQDWVDVRQKAWGKMWGHHENSKKITLGELIEQKEKSPEYYDFDGTFILFLDNEAIGICASSFRKLDDGKLEKTIDSPALIFGYDATLLEPLVIKTVQYLNSVGSGDFKLTTWGDSEESVAVYEHMGFVLEPKEHFIDYLLELK